MGHSDFQGVSDLTWTGSASDQVSRVSAQEDSSSSADPIGLDSEVEFIALGNISRYF